MVSSQPEGFPKESSTWAVAWSSPDGPDPEVVMERLRATGTLALAERLMDEDAAGIERPSLSFDEVRAWLDRFWSAR